MIPLSGFVYFDRNFKFKDGGTGKKLFVVLCGSSRNEDNVLVARTTSRKKSARSYGCHFPTKYEAVFFIPETDGFFDSDTWIRFDYLMEYDQNILSRWIRKGEMSIQQTKDMLSCGSESYTISGWQKDDLKEHSDILRV